MRYLQWLPGRCPQFGKRVEVGPATRLLAAFVQIKGYDYLHEWIRYCSGRPLLSQMASHHCTQSTKGIFARPVAVPSFQPRYPVLQPIDVLDTRPRSLPASPPSETRRTTKSATASASRRNVCHNFQRINGTPCALQSGDSTSQI